MGALLPISLESQKKKNVNLWFQIFCNLCIKLKNVAPKSFLFKLFHTVFLNLRQILWQMQNTHFLDSVSVTLSSEDAPSVMTMNSAFYLNTPVWLQNTAAFSLFFFFQHRSLNGWGLRLEGVWSSSYLYISADKSIVSWSVRSCGHWLWHKLRGKFKKRQSGRKTTSMKSPNGPTGRIFFYF